MTLRLSFLSGHRQNRELTSMPETTPPTTLKPWNEPVVEVLNVADSEIYFGRGPDGSTFPNSTRS